MGVEVYVDSMSKSFGHQNIWHNVGLTIPAGEISALLGPSGTGKSVFLKCLIGLLRPEGGSCVVDGVDIVRASERDLLRVRRLFGVLFQDGALFGSQSVFDNVAFPLREHTQKTEAEVRHIVLEKMEIVGLAGTDHKLPGEISGGMRKRAGLARALVLDPQILLVDEPDSGLDPVRAALLAQLLMDINAQIDATIVIVTHNISLARTLPDNLGMFFNRRLITFGPREQLFADENPVVKQFLTGSRVGPIGMTEEKDDQARALEQHLVEPHLDIDVTTLLPQLEPRPGLPPRAGLQRHRERLMAGAR